LLVGWRRLLDTHLSGDVRVRVLVADGDAVLLADALDLLDQRHDAAELFVRLAYRHLELLVCVHQALPTTSVRLNQSSTSFQLSTPTLPVK